MRTPGNDLELAAGFLYGEGVVRVAEDILQITHCDDRSLDDARRHNIVNVDLRSGVLPDLDALERHFYTTSACGVCGKASLEALRLRGCPVIKSGPEVHPDVLRSLPEKLRAAQGIFAATGGLHAAGLSLAPPANLLAAREDVGRHNAVDKPRRLGALGRRAAVDRTRADGERTAAASRSCRRRCWPASIVCSVSAPSSLAVSLAREFGITLVGFLRGDASTSIPCGTVSWRWKGDASPCLGPQARQWRPVRR
jgi:FdhD protein